MGVILLNLTEILRKRADFFALFLLVLDNRQILRYNILKVNDVHFEEVTKINPEKTSKEEILRICIKLSEEKGLRALNMRAVAGECGIALGTLYNYFSDKEDLLICTISKLWQDLFSLPPQHDEENLLFTEYVEMIFGNIRERIADYPDFFSTHSSVIARSGKSRALSEMERCMAEIRGTMLNVLRNDSAAVSDAFDGEFTRESFVEFVLDNIFLQLMQGKPCDTLIAVIGRTIYKEI